MLLLVILIPAPPLLYVTQEGNKAGHCLQPFTCYLLCSALTVNHPFIGRSCGIKLYCLASSSFWGGGSCRDSILNWADNETQVRNEILIAFRCCLFLPRVCGCSHARLLWIQKRFRSPLKKETLTCISWCVRSQRPLLCQCWGGGDRRIASELTALH